MMSVGVGEKRRVSENADMKDNPSRRKNQIKNVEKRHFDRIST